MLYHWDPWTWHMALYIKLLTLFDIFPKPNAPEEKSSAMTRQWHQWSNAQCATWAKIQHTTPMLPSHLSHIISCQPREWFFFIYKVHQSCNQHVTWKDDWWRIDIVQSSHWCSVIQVLNEVLDDSSMQVLNGEMTCRDSKATARTKQSAFGTTIPLRKGWWTPA